MALGRVGSVFNNTMRVVALAAAIALMAGLLVLTPWGQVMERWAGLYTLYRLRGPIAPPAEAVVVAMSRRTIHELDLPASYYNWPRKRHAELIERLAARGAGLIVFDVFFRGKKDAAGDSRLGGAIARSGRVALFQHWFQERVPVTGGSEEFVRPDMLVSPMRDFASVAVAMGPFPLPHIPQRVDEFWAYKRVVEEVPTLPVAALQAWALQSEADFREFLAAAGPDAEAAGRGYYASPKRPGDLLRLMRSLRAVFRGDAAAAKAVSDRLDGPAFQSLAQSRIAAFRALVRVYAGPDSYFLNFHGPARTVRTIPYHEVIGPRARFGTQGAGPARDLEGKVVFVGKAEFTTPDKEEGFRTVYSRPDGIDVSGVEILATAFANLLVGRDIQRPTPRMTFLIVSLFGLAVALIALLVGGARGIAVVVSMGLAYGAATHIAFARFDLWLPLFVPAVLLPLAAVLAGLFVQYTIAQRLVELIRGLVGTHMPPDIAKDISQGIEPHPSTHLVSGICLKTDLESFTSLSESVPPRELHELTNGYYELVGRSVEERNGTVLRYVGDGSLCAWTFEGDGRPMRLQSCLAALDIIHAMDAFNRSNASLQLPVHIGLHAGEFAIGSGGGGRHFEQVATGDMVNTASRIEGLTRQTNTKVLASDEVVEGLEELLVRRLGRFRFVGKTQPVAVSEVMGPREACGPAEFALCDRFHEMRAVFDAGHWDDAAEMAEKILSFHPDDGPSRFYARLCRGHGDAPLPAGEDGVIVMDRK